MTPQCNVNKRQIGTVANTKVYSVDFNQVKLLDPKFGESGDCNEGANGCRFPFVPQGEVWVDSNIDKKCWAPIILHEVIESFLMRPKDQGGFSITYTQAHPIALKYELDFRRELGIGTEGNTLPEVLPGFMQALDAAWSELNLVDDTQELPHPLELHQHLSKAWDDSIPSDEPIDQTELNEALEKEWLASQNQPDELEVELAKAWQEQMEPWLSVEPESYSQKHDLHGESGEGWIGVDLDGTLAEYDGWKGADKVGKPIEKMVDRVKKWVDDGKDVRIFTARVADKGDGSDEHEVAKEAIDKWCEEYIGKKLPITNIKDHKMLELWDDRAIQVKKNDGERVDGEVDKYTALTARTERRDSSGHFTKEGVLLPKSTVACDIAPIIKDPKKAANDLGQWKIAGFDVTIATPDEDTKPTENYLKERNIPFDKVVQKREGVPVDAHIYLDGNLQPPTLNQENEQFTEQGEPEKYAADEEDEYGSKPGPWKEMKPFKEIGFPHKVRKRHLTQDPHQHEVHVELSYYGTPKHYHHIEGTHKEALKKVITSIKEDGHWYDKPKEKYTNDGEPERYAKKSFDPNQKTLFDVEPRGEELGGNKFGPEGIQPKSLPGQLPLFPPPETKPIPAAAKQPEEEQGNPLAGLTGVIEPHLDSGTPIQVDQSIPETSHKDLLNMVEAHKKKYHMGVPDDIYNDAIERFKKTLAKHFEGDEQNQKDAIEILKSAKNHNDIIKAIHTLKGISPEHYYLKGTVWTAEHERIHPREEGGHKFVKRENHLEMSILEEKPFTKDELEDYEKYAEMCSRAGVQKLSKSSWIHAIRANRILKETKGEACKTHK